MPVRYLTAPVLALAVGALLAACGGGGGSDGSNPPSPVASVSSATAGSAVLGQPLLFTIDGSDLDRGLTLASAGCSNFTLGTTAPNLSTASRAYYTCTVTGTGAQQATVSRSSDGSLLATVAYAVPVPPAVATVSSATAGTAELGQPLLFTINGSALDAGLTLASAGCGTFTLGTTAPNISTASVAYYTCTVTGTGAQQATVSRSSDGTLLATVAYDVAVAPVVPTVISATADTPMYSRPLLFTVSGTNLDGNRIDLDSTACSDVTLSTSPPQASGASVAYFRCTVTQLGAQQATVSRASDGGVLARVDFTVPQPQVTLNVSNGATVGGGLVAGNVVITLEPALVPVTVDNFLTYVNSGFYDGTVFHRYVPGFVLQGGGYAAELNPAAAVPPLKPTRGPILLEVGVGLSNLRLSVAMARTGVLNSATSQFFVNVVDNVFLDTAAGGYAVFGNITAGAEVIDALPSAPCASYPALLGAGECLPYPNLTVLTARQTR